MLVEREKAARSNREGALREPNLKGGTRRLPEVVERYLLPGESKFLL